MSHNSVKVPLRLFSAAGFDRRQTSMGSYPATRTRLVFPVKAPPVSTRRKSIAIGSITGVSVYLLAEPEISGSHTLYPYFRNSGALPGGPPAESHARLT